MKTYKKKIIPGITIIILITAVFGTAFYIKEKNRDFLIKTDFKKPSDSNNKLTDEISMLKKELGNLKTEGKNSKQQSSEINRKLTALNKQLTVLTMQQMISKNKEYTVEPKNKEYTADNNDEESKKTDSTVCENEKFEAQINLQVDYMESAMESEESDPEWSNKASEQINTAYKNDNMKEFELISSECKTTMCKMEFLLNSEILAEEGFSKLSQNVPWDGQGFVAIKDGVEGEASRVVVYLAKEGHSLEMAR